MARCQSQIPSPPTPLPLKGERGGGIRIGTLASLLLVAILAAFSTSSPWQYMGYEIGTGKVIATRTVTYQAMVKDFAARKGWYGFFFDEPNGYTFRVNFLDGRMWKKKSPLTFVAPDSDSGRPAITWKQEGGKWVIQKITETTP